MKNLYAILGVHWRADAEALKQARRTQARKYHPDVSPHDAYKMVEVNEAYNTLTNPAEHKRYRILLGAVSYTCPRCQGRGTMRKQKSFTKVTETICQTCQGAGLLPKEQR